MSCILISFLSPYIPGLLLWYLSNRMFVLLTVNVICKVMIKLTCANQIIWGKYRSIVVLYRHRCQYKSWCLYSPGAARSHQICSAILYYVVHRQTYNISHTLVGNKIVDHSDVVGASPVGAAPTTSARRVGKQFFGFSVAYIAGWAVSKPIIGKDNYHEPYVTL